ncbi:rnd efflux pump membrane fusion protein [Desulfoluna butyratoxydans]|uniref:Rnd efflux pump membrane fusion protein n=2 Tax=Desulfoluna butyratoxydans TaxID=231438 RepID=A0A4U8YLV3_9BACT|nr:rnd efflux pump membrane fusion protein [Desulfoluna butyratoxydans]
MGDNLMGWKKKAVCGVAAGLLVAMTGCGGDKQQEPEVIRAVKYREVAPIPTHLERRFSGITKAGEVVRLSFRTGGKVETLEAGVGDRVKRGQVVATLDNRDARLNLEKALVDLEKSRIQSDNAKSNLQRTKALYENNNVSVSEYEKARDTYANASAAYDVDVRAVRLQKRELTYYTLASPMDGIITAREVEANENVSSGQVVAVVQAGDSIEVEAGIPELWIAQISQGQTADIVYPAMPDKRFGGRVTEVAFESDSETHTYPVTLVMEGARADIRPGMPASVVFRFKREGAVPALLVPVHAVAKDYAGHYVYTVEKTGEGEGTVTKIQVTVGRMMSDGFEILSGLKGGEKVVTTGVLFLTDGKKVKLLSD